MKAWKPEAIEAILAAQGIHLSAGRAAKIAAAMNAAAVDDALLEALPLEADPTTYAVAQSTCK